MIIRIITINLNTCYTYPTSSLDRFYYFSCRYADIKSISISGNRIRISTGVTTLNTVSEIVKILDEDTRNASVTVKSTKADSTYSERVTAEIEILYSGAGV